MANDLLEDDLVFAEAISLPEALPELDLAGDALTVGLTGIDFAVGLEVVLVKATVLEFAGGGIAFGLGLGAAATFGLGLPVTGALTVLGAGIT